MRWLIACTLVFAACRTPPLPSGDGGVAFFDLGAASDLSLSFAGDMCLGGCPTACKQGELCVFVNRGDCSTWVCAPRPANCAGTTSCACVGGDAFCSPFAQAAESITCVDGPAPLTCGNPAFAGFVCQSSVLCI